MIATVFIVMFLLLFVGVPIFIALSGATAVSFALFTDIDLIIVVQRMFAGINKFSLMSIPLFILAANLMSEGGISKRIVRLANMLVGRIPGGLGISAIAASMFFGAISGSAPATVVAIGAVLYPALIGQKYGESYSSGVITAAGSLGVIIPPSVTMIVYGTVTGSSVGTLFMAGITAGLLYGVAFILYTICVALKKGETVSREKIPAAEKLHIIKDSLWGLGVPVIILGGIYLGVFTPTEAAAVAAIYALVVAVFAYRELDLKGLVNCIRKAAVTTVQVMILLAAASVFAWMLTFGQVTTQLAALVLSISSNPWVILLLMNIILLVAGMFLDGASIVTILGPLLFPIAMEAGIDPIHLGMVMIVNTAIGMFTPPFGLNLFVASSITGQPVLKVAKGAVPFLVVSLLVLLLITYIPEISLWLPRRVYGAW